MSVSRFLKEVGRPVAYYPKLARMLDSVNAAVFLCQLLYWSDGRGADPEGWIYKTQIEVEEETGLTRRKQESVRKKLGELGVLEESRRGSHGTLHFKVDTKKLDELWTQWLKTPLAESANVQNRQRREAPSANGGKRQTLNKDTESTAENTLSARTREAVKVFAEVYGHDPHNHGQTEIETEVRERGPLDLKLWRETVRQCKANLTPAKNVGTVLTMYRERLERAQTRGSPPKPSQPPPTPEAREEEQARLKRKWEQQRNGKSIGR